MKSLKKFKVGDVVEVEFVDHTLAHEGDHGLAPCVVYGRLGTINSHYIQVIVWEARSQEDTEGRDSYSVAVGCIENIRRLK